MTEGAPERRGRGAQSTKWNFLGGAAAYIVVVLSAFLTRTVFVHVLGVSYLGLNAVFMNVVALVSVAEAGIATAGMFRLYRPIADGDSAAVGACLAALRFFFRAALIVTLILGAGGALVIPRLTAEFEVSGFDTVLLFALVLGNAVAACVFATDKVLLLADQRQYIVVGLQSCVLIVQTLGQLAALSIWASFAGFLVVQIVGTLVWNVLCRLWARRRYPQEYFRGAAQSETRRHMGADVLNVFPYKVGAIILSATDAILISALLRLTLAGVVSNYALIVNSVNGVLMQAFNGIAAAIGIHNVKATKARRTTVFYQLSLLSVWLFGWASICLLGLLNPFIALWLGERFVLETWEVAALVSAFYVTGTNQVPSLYRSALGLFRKTRLVPICAAVLNIALSVLLAQFLGLTGIFLGTVLARGLTFSIVDPILVIRMALDGVPRQFFLRMLRGGAGVAVVGLCASVLGSHAEPGILPFVWLMGIVCPGAAIVLGAWLCFDHDFRGLIGRLNRGFQGRGASGRN